jgi:hypothetical protein
MKNSWYIPVIRNVLWLNEWNETYEIKKCIASAVIEALGTSLEVSGSGTYEVNEYCQFA